MAESCYTPNQLLQSLRGKGTICGCGKPLVPVIVEGVQIGVTHETAEDDDYHCSYLGGLVVEIDNHEREEEL